MRNLTPAVLIASVLAAIAVPFAVSQAADSQPSPAADQALARADNPDGATSAPGAPQIGALRRAQKSTDRLDAATAKNPLISDGVADVSSARKVQLSGSVAGHLFPGKRDSVCLMADGFLNCPYAKTIVEKGAAAGAGYRGDTFYVFGIASDAVKSVIVTGKSGSEQEIPVRESSFYLQTTDAPVSVNWSFAGDAQATTFPGLAEGPPAGLPRG